MENAITALLATLPNLAVAIWVLRQNQLTIEKLLANQQRLIDELVDLCAKDLNASINTSVLRGDVPTLPA